MSESTAETPENAATDEPPPVCERCGGAFAEGEVAVAAGGSNGNVYYHRGCVKA